MSENDRPAHISRRRLLEMSGLGLGTIALTSLLKAEQERLVYSDLKPRKGPFPARAGAVIQMVQNGGPSQMDLFDPKPELTKRAGQAHPDGVEIHQPNNANVLLPSPFQFRRHGQSGMVLGETMPHLATVADELCVIRSMHTEHNNHPEGLNMLQTCQIFPGRPVLGAWVSYALGTENQDLPPSWCCAIPKGTRRPESSSGPAAGWRLSFREWSSVPARRRCVTCIPPCRRRRVPSARGWTRWPSSTVCTRAGTRASPSWKHGSRTTSWRLACSLPPWKCWTYLKSLQPPASSTAWTIPSPPAMARAA